MYLKNSRYSITHHCNGLAAIDVSNYDYQDLVAEFYNNLIDCGIDGIRIDYEDGFTLIRQSNTGPVLTVRFERKNINDLDPRFWEDFPYCELYRKGVSKSKTIDEVAFKLNIPSEKIIVFGDAQNDYEMLKDHKNSYVMINGLETLRQVASKISEFSNNEDGVKIELEKLFKI